MFIVCICRTLSNTAPAYLESMQRIVLSVDEINGEEDVDNFVSSFPGLHKSPEVPHLELHKCSVRWLVRFVPPHITIIIIINNWGYYILQLSFP